MGRLRRRKPKKNPPRPRAPIAPPAVFQNVTLVTVPVGPKIAIVNHQAVNPLELGPAAQALARQCNEHLALPPPVGYGIGARIRAIDSDDPPPAPDEWVLHLWPGLDVGFYGVHYVTDNGLPAMDCYPDLDERDGVPWTVTASHEILETLIDPHICRGAQAPDGRWWALEICDSTEADYYLIDGVAVSNFVTPVYFEPPEILGALKLDHMGLVKAPFEIRPGGYGQYWWNGSWEEVFVPFRPRQYRARDVQGRGRSARRRGRVAGGVRIGVGG